MAKNGFSVNRRLDRQCPRPVGAGVGADRVEGDVAEVEEPGEADDHVQAQGQEDVDADLVDEDLLPVTPKWASGR